MNKHSIEKASDFYEAVRQSQSLKWLLREPETINGKDPLQEYDWVMQNVKRMRREGSLLVLGIMILVAALGGFIIFFCRHKWGTGEGIFAISVSASLAVFLMVMFPLVSGFYPKLEEYIGLWIDANWKTQSFREEVNLIVKAATSSLSLIQALPRLGGSDDEASRAVVPRIVSERCDRHLLSEAVNIRGMKEEFPGQLKYAKHQFAELLRIYKKYKILPPGASREEYRQRALKQAPTVSKPAMAGAM